MTPQPKGQHGGPRANSGGARAGAGRPRKPPVLLELPTVNDPLVFLLAVMNDSTIDISIRVEAAKVLMPYHHAKRVDAGVRDEKQLAAKKAATGKFSAAAPPLRVIQ